jgi:UDP-N-acetylmuramate dehydrogenase
VKILENISLKPYNTFGIEASARYFIEVNSVDMLREALNLKGYPAPMILSGGSNILITGDLDALVLHINIRGVRIIREDEKQVVVCAMAGENWHQLVLWCLEHDFGGIENLSLIPGRTGTAPIQNIGAYGVEIKDVFDSCEALETATGKLITFSAAECDFGYRSSFFKGAGKGKYIITSVNLRLTKNEHHLNTAYGAIEAELRASGCTNPGIGDVSRAVVAIRRSKLPDPNSLGNSGSFFKNPVLVREQFEKFNKAHPQAPFFHNTETTFKVPAGWLIEQCGFKGKRFGDAGVHDKQALVLVNYGKASGSEVLALARKIQMAVYSTYGLQLEPEVNIIGPE